MPEPSPAGWYPDPFDRHERRYWDSSNWTDHVVSRGCQEVDPPVDRPQVPTVNTAQPPAAWHPDPFGRHERRYWDGGQWSHHVLSRGSQGIDPPVGGATVPTESRQGPNGSPPPMVPPVGGSPKPTVDRASKKVQRQVHMSGVPDRGQVGNEALFTEPVLVVNQKAKLFGVNAEYAVYDQEGRQIGAVQEVGQRLIKKAMGAGGAHGTHRFQIVDPNGRVLIALNRPAMLLKSKMTVVGANGTQGEIVQKTLGVIGKVRFSLESGGQTLGSINAEDWQEWGFSIQDAAGAEIARITKTWAGWAKERFTKADNYVVQIHRPLEEPLRSLAIAAALAVDTALKQGNQTSGSWGTRRYK